MPLELADLATVAAELMDELEEEYASKEDVQLGVVAVVAEVNWSDGDGGVTAVQYRCSDSRRWVQVGLFDAAKRGVLETSEDAD